MDWIKNSRKSGSSSTPSTKPRKSRSSRSIPHFSPFYAGSDNCTARRVGKGEEIRNVRSGRVYKTRSCVVAGSVINIPDAAFWIVSAKFTRTLTITWTSSRKWGLKNGWRREKGIIDGNEDGPRTGTWNYDADKCCEALFKQYNPTDTSLSVFSLRAKHFYAEFMELPGVLESIVDDPVKSFKSRKNGMAS